MAHDVFEVVSGMCIQIKVLDYFLLLYFNHSFASIVMSFKT